MALSVIVNGQDRTFADLKDPAALSLVVEKMKLLADRVAVEHNGEIAPRAAWATVTVKSGDRLEVVHFVGGGGASERIRRPPRGALSAPKL